jgi:enoyl-CoA hydratase
MGTLVRYQHAAPVATITMDDGKVNVLSPDMLAEVHAALDQAAADDAVVLLTGRDGIFSAGFDLAVLNRGGSDARRMLGSGFELADRLLSHPMPVVIGCTGHAIAMAAFLLLAGDYRVGAAGPFKITANEVAIGMPLPQSAIELCRQRLTPAAFTRATLLAEVFAPDAAVGAGFLDRVTPPTELPDVGRGVAAEFAKLDHEAHRATKARVREPALAALRGAMAFDGFRAADTPEGA